MKNKTNLFSAVALSALVVVMILLMINDTEATSQWSRKYEVVCTTCHTAFPRLNYYGEQFFRNCYQLPGEQDGDEMGKEDLGGLYFSSVYEIFGRKSGDSQPVEKPVPTPEG